MKRIEKLRNRVLNSNPFGNEFHYLFFKEYEKLPHLPEKQRYSEAFYYAFLNLTPSISDGELIVGKRDTFLSEKEQKEWDEIYYPIAVHRIDRAGGGQDSHMAIDYELILSVGIKGIIDKINEYMKDCDEEAGEFYLSCQKCLQAVIKHSERYSDQALLLSEKTSDPVRKDELIKISEICKKVPARPAETFYEAVQSVHFITHCVSLNPLRLNAQQFQLGRPDRYLLSYYINDIKKGIITKEYAQLLLDCLGIQINMRVPNGLSSGYMVGGCDENGKTVANELTEMCMKVVDDIRLVYPAVGFCYTEDMPDKYLKEACRLLSKGLSHPAIFNDTIITKGLMSYGVPESQAHNYIHSTCVEITPIAASNVWVASPYTNMIELLLDCMNREYCNFDELLSMFFSKLDTKIKMDFEEHCSLRTARAKNSMNPLLSCFVNDCLKQGKDIENGGARYQWIMPSFVGMANLVDSLYVIKKTVFEQRRLTLCQFKEILDNNFEGNEPFRLYILNHIPKYGNDIDDIDCYFNMLSEHIIGECEKYSGIHANENLIPSVFCWIMHEQFGRNTIASPDGRLAGFPLGDGSGPCQGREMNGPTASVISSTKWEHYRFIGGVAVNLKFSKASLGTDSVDNMAAIIKTYLKRGGFELQINVVDNETLKKAQLNPEEYKDLVVRIGGYSDYFVRLSREMQEEVILRTAHHA